MFDTYKKTVIGDVTTFQRPYQTISTGPLGQPNTLTIFEEKITVLPDASTESSPVPTPELTATITDPSVSFNLVDPTTGVVTGTKTFAQLKIDMYSLYLYLAAIRDGV